MDFEWDENKSNSNKTKHAIDFSTAQLMWDDANRVEIEAPYPLERRGILISKIGKKPLDGNIYKARQRNTNHFCETRQKAGDRLV